MQSSNTPEHWKRPTQHWNGAESDLICCHIQQETHDVKSFWFKPASPALFRHLPGQFVTLELLINGETVNRSYTISSAPTQPDRLSITVKRQPDGLVSNWLHDYLKVGDRVSALGPSGDFSAALHPAKKYLFLSGGSGITPVMSMARAFFGLAEQADIVFAHSARTPKDIIFKDELDYFAKRNPQFKPIYVCERDVADIDAGILTGYFDLQVLSTQVTDFKEREVFTCGPQAYMTAVRHLLAEAGYDMAHYHEESFNFAELSASLQADDAPEPTALKSKATQAEFKLHFKKAGVTVACSANQFILQAAKQAGLRIPSACSKGLCGTCKSALISGQVDMKHGGGIRAREIEQGLFLPCCSKPLSDIEIDR